MKQFEVTTDHISNQGLTARRRLHVGEKSVETPTVATPVSRAAQKDTFTPESRGVNEIYRTVDTESLTRSMRQNSSSIGEDIESDYRKTNEDEVNIVFTSYQDGHRIGPDEARHLVDILEQFTNILTVPLMPDLVGTVDGEDGDISDSAFRSYKESIKTFLDAAAERAPHLPIMGTIPPLGWEFNRRIMHIYGETELRAFCLNFNRRRATAARQVSMVKPLMQHIARRDIAKGILTYAINLDPYGQPLAEDVRPAADLATFGMGIDIIGDCHVSPGGYGGDDDGEEEIPTFRLLNKDTYVYQDVRVEDLANHIPEDTGLDPDRIVGRSKRSPDGALYQMQKLLNMEQMALAANELREVPSDNAFNHLVEKPGVTDKTEDAYIKVRDGFDEGSSQTGLSDF